MAERALVFDFGLRRIGVASANRATGTTSALPTIPASDGQPEWHVVATLIRDWQPEVLVIGLPRHADGSDSPMTERARAFGAWLHGCSGLGIEEIDERWTSTEAEELLREQRRSGDRRRRLRPGDVDLVAARLLAESWLRG